MTRKESEFLGFDIKAIVVSSFIGLGVYLVLTMCAAMMMVKDMLPFSATGAISKAVFFVAALICCAYAKAKGRGEAFFNCLAAAIFVFGYAVLLFLIYPEREWDVAGLVTCMMLCILSCLIMMIRKNKNSKMHKRNRKR